MTPQEKAKELVEKFMPYVWSGASYIGEEEVEMILDNPKQCALILVEEIIKENHAHAIYYKDLEAMQKYLIDWQQVKQEIEKL